MHWPFSTNPGDDAPDGERDAALARLWDATRPAEPDDAAWDAVWSRVRERLDQDAPRSTPTIKFPTRRAAVIALLLAQAAAILVAVALWNTPRGANPTPGGDRIAVNSPAGAPVSTPAAAPVARGTIEIVPGQIVMIHADGDRLRAETVSVEEEDSSNRLAGFIEVEDFYMMFNKMEAGLETQLARND